MCSREIVETSTSSGLISSWGNAFFTFSLSSTSSGNLKRAYPLCSRARANFGMSFEKTPKSMSLCSLKNFPLYNEIFRAPSIMYGTSADWNRSAASSSSFLISLILSSLGLSWRICLSNLFSKFTQFFEGDFLRSVNFFFSWRFVWILHIFFITFGILLPSMIYDSL